VLAALPYNDDSALFSAACTQSIVGDDTYFDVITVEFTHFSLHHALLLRRIRQRFPLSTIVLVQLFFPRQLQTRTTDGEFLSFADWRRNAGLGEQQAHILPASRQDWTLPTTGEDGSLLQESLQEVKGVHIMLPFPKKLAVPTEMARFLSYFQDDWLLSAAGHEQIANQVRALLPTRSSLAVTGTWGSGDACHLWYASGDYDLASVTAKPVQLRTHGADTAASLAQSSLHKHALEFSFSPGNQDTKTVVIHNPFDKDRMLYLTYLTDEEMAYPRTRVLINGRPTVVLHPFHEQQVDGDGNVSEQHVARTTPVGFVPPGRSSTLTFHVQQQTELPFRLLGMSLLVEDDALSLQDIEFSLEPERLFVPRTEAVI
jgi:hypothetical protein